MGHVLLGALPATKKWRQVVALLDTDELRVDEIARTVGRACDRSLAQAVNDPAFVEALWMLLEIPLAAKELDFRAALADVGISVPIEPTLADILAGFVDAVERARSRSGRAVTDFSLIARNAALQALESVTIDRSPSLWNATTEDQRTTIATFASTERFGELAQRFFTNLLQGHLRYFLDREVPLHVGRSSSFRSIADTSHFEQVIRQHCVETTVIMRAFAKEWLGKNRFHLGRRDLTRQDAAGFAAYAFTKVRNELLKRSGLAQ
jgi:hypothetical protein